VGEVCARSPCTRRPWCVELVCVCASGGREEHALSALCCLCRNLGEKGGCKVCRPETGHRDSIMISLYPRERQRGHARPLGLGG